MRILHLIESLEFGGGEKVLVDLANAMCRTPELQATVIVCCTRRLGALQSQLDASIRVLCLHAGEGLKFKVVSQLAKIINDERIDVVHVHNWSIFVEAALATFQSSPRALLQTVHGRYMPYPPGLVSKVKVTVRHWLEQVLSRRYQQIVPVSDSIGAYVMADVGIPASKVLTIRNGIPRIGWTFFERKISNGPLTVIAVGRLADIKNHALLVRAFAVLAKEQLPVRLQLVGDGPERSRLEQLTKELQIESAVEFLGFRDDIDALLHAADIYVLSSRYEGISIALLEAMRASLPIVATRVGGVAETVDDGINAILTTDDRVDEMVQAIKKLLLDRQLRIAMGRAGFERFAENFSLEATVRNYLELYASSKAA